MDVGKTRRRVLQGISVGAAGVGAALGEMLASREADVSAAPGPEKTRDQPKFIWDGRIGPPTFVQHPDHPTEEGRYLVTSAAVPDNGMMMRRDRQGGYRKHRMSNRGVDKMMQRYAPGQLEGQISLRIDGANFRLFGAELDTEKRLWTLDLKQYSGPKPELGTGRSADATLNPEWSGNDYRYANGCGCGACEATGCWHCDDGDGKFYNLCDDNIFDPC